MIRGTRSTIMFVDDVTTYPGGYEREILKEQHQPPTHLAHLYEYRPVGCTSRICACTGECKTLGFCHKVTGNFYKTNKQKALLRKRATLGRKKIARMCKLMEGHVIYSKRNSSFTAKKDV